MTHDAFASLPAEVLEQFRAVARTGHWGRGGVLFQPGDPADTLYLLTRGGVRLYALRRGGREVMVLVHLEGDLVGMQALLPGRTYDFYAECTDDTKALILGRETLDLLRRESPELEAGLAAGLARQLTALQGHLSALVFYEVSQRLAATLLSLAERQGPWLGEEPFALQDRFSHQELAYIVGSTRETITKLLGEFRARGLLDLGYRRIILTDREGLLRASREPLE